MLRLVEDKSEKIEGQTRFADSVRNAWRHRERRTIVWRPAARELEIAHDGQFWFASTRLGADHPTPRFWNSFGIYRPEGELQITLEINIPTETNSGRVSGFLARAGGDHTLLMHDGGIGGGRKGIGRNAFLAWSGAQPQSVEDSSGTARAGLVITPIESKRIGALISGFVEQVAQFKRLAASGELESEELRRATQSYADYFAEFYGTKKGRRTREFEYISRHGEIVHALFQWRKRHFSPAADERVVKNAFIDLGVTDARGELIELYEVKTSTERGALYSAIGQIMVHRAGASNVRSFIVVPTGEALADDLAIAAEQLGIRLLRYELTDAAVEILE